MPETRTSPKALQQLAVWTAPVQVRPSPVKPASQVQLRPPGVLVHVAYGEQPPLEVVHSFTSVV